MVDNFFCSKRIIGKDSYIEFIKQKIRNLSSFMMEFQIFQEKRFILFNMVNYLKKIMFKIPKIGTR